MNPNKTLESLERLENTKKEHIFSISEVFASLEGEGPYTGYPTAYIRFSKCNLKCPGFNNYTRDGDTVKVTEITQDGYATLGFEPTDYKDIYEMPIITRGCDSQYAVNPDFKSTWMEMSTTELLLALRSEIPGGSFVSPSGLSWAVSLTGGEPLLNWKHFRDILFHPLAEDIHHYIVETNGTVPVSKELASVIQEWLNLNPKNVWTWSCSPKLESSGHSYKERIKPKVLAQQSRMTQEIPGVNGYLKFVCSDDEESFKEIQDIMEDYYSAGMSKDYRVLIMPESCTAEQQNTVAAGVADLCMHFGYIFCYRLHNTLWGNVVGV